VVGSRLNTIQTGTPLTETWQRWSSAPTTSPSYVSMKDVAGQSRKSDQHDSEPKERESVLHAPPPQKCITIPQLGEQGKPTTDVLIANPIHVCARHDAMSDLCRLHRFENCKILNRLVTPSPTTPNAEYELVAPIERLGPRSVVVIFAGLSRGIADHQASCGTSCDCSAILGGFI